LAELSEHRGKGRSLQTQPPLKSARAHAERTTHAVQREDPLAQLGEEHPAHSVLKGVCTAECCQGLLGEVVEITGEGFVRQAHRPGEIVISEQEGSRERAELERPTVESFVLPYVRWTAVRKLHSQRHEGRGGEFSAC